MQPRNRVLGAFVGVAAMILAGLAHAEDPSPRDPTSSRVIVPGKTGKERLGDKASDEQRVDNCKVPPERRGAKIRSDMCSAAK